jgi:hypothetical protein
MVGLKAIFVLKIAYGEKLVQNLYRVESGSGQFEQTDPVKNASRSATLMSGTLYASRNGLR